METKVVSLLFVSERYDYLDGLRASAGLCREIEGQGVEQ